MIDIHTHILPELDDGSRSVKESLEMLGMLSKQGVDTVVATPHFYIDNTNPNQFLEDREKSIEKLKKGLAGIKKRPRIAVGAEVQFYPGLYNMEEIDSFCLGKTKYLLVEMPFSAWTQHTYHALGHLYTERGIVPVIAHVERYAEFQEDWAFISRLKAAHALIQVNASFFIERATRRKAVTLFKKDGINFIGSDAHGVEYRTPDIDKAVEVIRKKLGVRGIDVLDYWENRITENMTTF